MLAKLRMELFTNSEDIGIYQSSNMQGVLMEQIDSSYADILHQQGLNPYSQHIERGEHSIWEVNTLTEEAYEKVMKPLLDSKFQEFIIKKKGIEVQIGKKEIQMIEEKEFLKKFYEGETNRYIDIEFITPTSFKSDGNYVNMPDIRLIFQSLMNKYSGTSFTMDMYDEETMEQLVRHSRITKYNLRSAYFPLESVKIPAFRGEMTIKVHGTETMARYARFLAEFGTYSGVGIKAGIGMGAIRLRDWRKYNDK